MVRQAWLWAWTTVGVLAFVGCGPNDRIQLCYERPAEVVVEPAIRALGIAEFGGQTAEDRKWGAIASDRLAEALDESNRKYDRFVLVDRRRLSAILDEQDLQAAFSDSSQAAQAGKLAHVDAMIYGTVHSSTQDETVESTAFDPIRQSARTVTRIRRHVMMSVNFTIDDVQTGKTIATDSVVREFDSEKQDATSMGKIGKLVGFSGGAAPPADQIAVGLIDQCVQEFLRKISPHVITAEEALGKGKSEIVKTGNTLAVAGDYPAALEAYLAGVKEIPEDHQAVFNAGLMYEALGELDLAEQQYHLAFQMKPEPQYVMARQRVRQEAAR